MNVFNRLASLSIRTRLIIVVLAAALFLLITALVAVARFTALAQPAAESALQVIARERSAILNRVATRLVSVPQSLAQNGEVRSALARLTTEPESAEALTIARDAFQNVLNDNLSIQQIRFVTLNGKVLASVPTAATTDDRTAPYYDALQSQPITGDAVYIGKLIDKPLPTFDLVALVRGDANSVGYLVVSADPTGKADTTQFSVYDALQTADYTSGTVIFYLVNNDQASTLESPFNSPLTVGDDTRLTTRLLTTRVFTRPAILPSPLTGQRALLYVTPVDAFGKWLVAESRAVQIAGGSEVGNFNFQLALLVLGLVVVLALLAYWFDSTLVPPLRHLQTYATEVVQGRGQDSLKIVNQDDEIGALAQALNTISVQLRTNIQTLQDRLADRVRDIEATREIGQIISSLRDVDPLLGRVVSLIQQRFPQIYHVQVYLVDDKGENAVLRVATGEVGEELVKRGVRVPVGGAGLIGRVSVEGRSIVSSDANLLPLTTLPDTRVELVLPLRTKLDLIGVLDLHSKQPNAFAEDDVNLFQTVADQLAIAITNARLFEESQARLHEIETLNRQFLSDAWRNYANQRRRTQTGLTQGVDEPWSDLQLEAIQTARPVEQRQEDTVTLAIPIMLRGVVLGAVECDIPQSSYNDNVRMLAFELANRLAVTSDSARLFDQSVRAAEREALINEISGKLTQQTEVSQILQVAVKELGQALRVPQTSIRLTRAKSVSQQGERKK